MKLRMSFGKSNLHANWFDNIMPPMPGPDASVQLELEGSLSRSVFILTPFYAQVRRWSQNLRSSNALGDSFTYLLDAK